MTKEILILSPFFSPNIGGVETHLDDWASYLAEHGVPAWVVTFQPLTVKAKGPGYEERGTVRILRFQWIGGGLFHHLEKIPVLQFLYLTPALLFSALWFFFTRRQNVGVIHAHGLNAAFVGWVLKKSFGLPCVLSTHAVYAYSPASFTGRVSNWIIKRLDRVICLSDASCNQMKAYGVVSEKIGRFRYWVDQDLFCPGDKADARRALNLGEGFTVLFVGRLIPIKGADILLQIAARRPEWKFLFVGTGPMEAQLKRANETYENVWFFGGRLNSEVARFFRACDVFVIPSQYEEGFGRVIIEALSCGCPVVGSDCGGVREALAEGRGTLVRRGDSHAFEKALQKIYEGKTSFPAPSVLRRKAEEVFSKRNGETILNYLYERMSA